jgi:hypothetical protein
MDRRVRILYHRLDYLQAITYKQAWPSREARHGENLAPEQLALRSEVGEARGDEEVKRFDQRRS